MYEELVKRLRAQAEAERFYVGEEMLYSQAADAIEELSKPMVISVDHQLSKEEIERLRRDMADAPIVLIPKSENAEPWLCLSCRHYPPSSTDGKPCSQCNPSEVWHSCYDPAEEGE